MSGAQQALIESFAYLDVRRNKAEAAIAQRYPVLFAVWDALGAGTSPGWLAHQLGVSVDRVRLLEAVGGFLIDAQERGMTP